MMAAPVFISYASPDKEIADAVCKKLEDAGITCWIAPRNIRPGANYGGEIIEAINHCKVMVLVFSAKSNASVHVQREIERAVSKGPRIIPFRIEDIPMSPEMEYYISSCHWMDALSQPLEPHLDRLLSAVSEVVGKGPGAPKPSSGAGKPPPPPDLEWDDEEPNNTPTPKAPAPRPDLAVKPKPQAPPARPNTQDIDLDHFVYGSYGGYTMKSKSAGVDQNGHTEPFKGMLLPIKQSDVKGMTEIRAVLPCGWDLILLCRIIKGEKDDKGRGTIANHTAIIPRKLLLEGKITYEGIDKAMSAWESVAQNLGAVGSIPKLKVPAPEKQMDLSELKNYIPKNVLDKMVENYKKDKERKIFINYKNSTEEQRVKAAYLLSMFLDMKLKVAPLAIFTDVPYRADDASPFNLVLSKVMIPIKPGGAWGMMSASTESYADSGQKKSQEISSALNDLYK